MTENEIATIIVDAAFMGSHATWTGIVGISL